MERDKVVHELHEVFMARTNLDLVSWAPKISDALYDVLEMCFGCGYDTGRNEIYYTHSKSVVQMDDYGNVVNTFNSINMAASSIGGDGSNIRACISGRQHTAYGYHWRSLADVYNQKDEEDVSGD